MKSFASYIEEKVVLRQRKNMPQIKDMKKFTQDITKEGYKLSSDSVEPKTLKPTQSEFNMEKVKGMIKDGAHRGKPIITTSDNYILDGHHRWKANMTTGEKQDIAKVDMTFDDLYDFVDGKDYVEYKQIHESQLLEWYNTNMSMADYMTDEEYEKHQKAKVDKTYKDFFTPEMFDAIYKSMSIKEDGDGGAAAGGEGSSGAGEAATDASTGEDGRENKNKLNSVANVSMPNTMNRNILRRKGGRADDDADIASTGN